MTDLKALAQQYVIVIEKGEGNYGAWAPDLSGCVAVGDTPQACERNMREAIEFHLEGMIEDGEPVPESSSRTVMNFESQVA